MICSFVDSLISIPRYFKRYGINIDYVTDRFKNLLPCDFILVTSFFKVRFHCPNGIHARFIDDELAYLMKKSGFITLRLGLETIDRGVRLILRLKFGKMMA
jgi:hypothetical protein